MLVLQPLLRTARLLTAGDRHAAEDLVQTALEKAYVAWPRIRRKGAQEAYHRSRRRCSVSTGERERAGDEQRREVTYTWSGSDEVRFAS